MTAVPAPPPAPAPEQQWRENEDGPECSCGNPTVVKLMPDGSAALLCLFHTSEAALFTSLPAERPAGWPARAATAPEPEAPAYRPDQLLSARHDTPDQTGAVTDWEPVTEAATPPMALAAELDKIADGFAGDGRKCADAGDQTGARIYSAIATTYRADAERIRERLAPAWDALAARLAGAQAALEEIRTRGRDNTVPAATLWSIAASYLNGAPVVAAATGTVSDGCAPDAG